MPEQLYRSALTLYRQHKYRDAAALAGRAVAVDPKLVNGWRLRADCCSAEGNLQAAVAYLWLARDAAEPGSRRWISASLHLAETLLRTGQQGDVVTVLAQLPYAALDHVEPLARAAYLYSCCEAHREALQWYERALQLAPQNRELQFNCAAANRAMGNLARAEALYDRLIAANPRDFEAYKNRSDLRRQAPDNNHIDELNQRLQQPELPAAGASQLQFALAKEYEDLGECDRSFAALQQACQLRRRSIRYDAAQDLRRLRTIADTFDAHFFRRDHAAEPSAGAGIIFILGMPRTGTTLAQRLLCCGDDVYSAGEPDTFARLLMELAPPGEEEEALVARARRLNLAQLGRRYEAELRSRFSTRRAPVIIDKNPMNFLYAGLIRRALPAAKIVHLRRHPVDTGYAVLKTPFRDAYPFSYDQRELAYYYLGYRALMEHWQRVIPGQIYDLHYERLVADVAAESRALFRFCGLPWSAQVLEFHRQDKQGTATASASQVRQPVYSASVGKWKHFRAWLQPMIEVLREGGVEID
ncbi:sulfotransferase [Microbulbifer sp. SAOS-129_SWC]|uniref:tetratricopeptide repeat-containing sulfotransferase family protein n=1 Tax=Microbulbifer sp. SAOS-129_SWC TaxID=3145235 RepID=UPI003216A5AB